MAPELWFQQPHDQQHRGEGDQQGDAGAQPLLEHHHPYRQGLVQQPFAGALQQGAAGGEGAGQGVPAHQAQGHIHPVGAPVVHTGEGAVDRAQHGHGEQGGEADPAAAQQRARELNADAQPGAIGQGGQQRAIGGEQVFQFS